MSSLSFNAALQGISKAYSAAPQAISEAFSVAFPKIHDLFRANYAAATDQNKDLKVSRYTPIGFNQMIDHAISMIGQEGQTKETIAGYLEGKKDFVDFDDDCILIPFNRDLMTQLVDKIRGTNSDSELKTELLKIKQASEGSEFSAKWVTKLINLSTSLANTAAQSNKVEWTDLSAQRLNLRCERADKIAAAEAEYHQNYNQLAELEKLLRDLAGINASTTSNDIDAFFNKFLELKPFIVQLIGSGNEQAGAVSRLLDQIDDNPDSKIAFFKDLQKTESDYFTILMRSVVKAEQKVIEKAAPLYLANREVRTEGFDKFDLRFDPRTGIIFKDVFNKCNNFEAPTKWLSKLVQKLNTSLIDPSKGSFWATTANVALVGLFVIFKMAQAVVSLGLASICYLGGLAAWVIGKSGRYIFGQGLDRLKDYFDKTHIPKNNNLELQAEIAKSDRPTNLLTGLRLTDFYKAYEAHEAARLAAEAAARLSAVLKRAPKRADYQKGINAAVKVKKALRANVARLHDQEKDILKRAEEAEIFFAKLQQHEGALAERAALEHFKSRKASMTQSLEASRRAGQATHNQALFRSARVDGQAT